MNDIKKKQVENMYKQYYAWYNEGKNKVIHNNKDSQKKQTKLYIIK